MIGKVTPVGEVTEYPRPSAALAYSITSGPDDNLWFVEWVKGKISRITTGGEVTSFQLPDPKSHPTAITAGPDGNLWFSEGTASRIGRITPGGEIKEFALPAGRHPGAITAGAEGNLWFTERAGARVGRITTAGRITEFRIPGPEVKPGDIVAGPDGNLWFAQEGAAKIGRITPRGVINQFAIPTPYGADAIVSGPEGRLWFAAGNLVGAISTGGAVSWPACLVQYCFEPPAALAMGPEGGLWVATAPIRYGATSLLLVCGLPEGCSGQLRVGEPGWEHEKRVFRVLGKAPYSLSEGESRRISVPLFRATLKEIREWPQLAGDYPYFAQVEAGPPGKVEARRGPVILAFSKRSG